MKLYTSRLDPVFRALGEATAIVMLSCGTYLVIALEADPKSSPESAAGLFGCGGPLLAFCWFVTRIFLYSKRRATSDHVQNSQTPGYFESMNRANLKRIPVPSLKQKKRKNDEAGSDSIYLIEGYGTQATDPIDLDFGMYRVAYQFAPGMPITVKLIQCLSGEEKVLLADVSGTGSQTFMVEDADRYMFQVAVAGAYSPAWKIELEQL